MVRGNHVLIGLLICLTVFLVYTAYDTGQPARMGVTGEFTVIVLPDTQKYSEKYPGIFMNQTRWIVSQIRERNIVFVSHEGDIVEHAGNIVEWGRANASMSVLDGRVPYGVLPGNHDKPTKNYNTYFPASRFSGYDWYGGSYNGNDNSYQLFSAEGQGYIIVHMEHCPKEDVVDWAGGVLEDHRDRRAIVVTHGYLGEDGGRSVHGCRTQYIFDDLIAPSKNVFLVLCGHVHSEVSRSDTVGGRVVHQLLADYQDETRGGNGWLRILEFSPGDGLIHVRTYSPYLDIYQTDEDSEFTLNYGVRDEA